MKTIVLLIISCMTLTVLPARTQDFEFEKDVYECIKQCALSYNIDMDAAIAKFETELISAGVLKDGRSTSYYSLLEKLVEDGEIPSATSYLLYDEEIMAAANFLNFDMSEDCYDCIVEIIENVDYENTYLNKVDQAYAEAENMDEPNMVRYEFGVPLSILPPEAFDMKFYKIFVLSQYILYQEPADDEPVEE